MGFNSAFKALNPTCHLLALLGVHHILHVSKKRVNTGTDAKFDKKKTLCSGFLEKLTGPQLVKIFLPSYEKSRKFVC